jgi:Isocitrate/isopropylmalate dehydrogenase
MIKIATISGDGVGPEIIFAAKKVLNSVAERRGISFDFQEAPMGGVAIDTFGTPMPESSVEICLKSASVLLGAVGGPKWNNPNLRPESALLGIRKRMGLYTNFRSAKLYPELKHASPLSSSITANGYDLVIVRELTGGYISAKAAIAMANSGAKLSTPRFTAKSKSSALLAQRTSSPKHEPNGFALSIRLTFWKAAVCGERSFTILTRITRRYSSPICSWTTPQCSLLKSVAVRRYRYL